MSARKALGAWMGALLLLAPTGAAWADQRECGNLMGMLRHLNERRGKETALINQIDKYSEHFVGELTSATAQAAKGDNDARAELPRIRYRLAHAAASHTAAREMLQTIEQAITEVTFDLASKCPQLLKTTPPSPQAAVPPPPQATPNAAGGLAPNQGVYTLTGRIQPCGPRDPGSPLTFTVTNGAVSGSYIAWDIRVMVNGTVDGAGKLRFWFQVEPSQMDFRGTVALSNGRWRAEGPFANNASWARCSTTWSAEQTPS